MAVNTVGISLNRMKANILGQKYEDPDEAVVQDYRLVFYSEIGRRVLGHMLAELHFFDEILDDPEEIALANYARNLLSRLGMWPGYRPENVGAIVDAFFSINFKPKSQGG